MRFLSIASLLFLPACNLQQIWQLSVVNPIGGPLRIADRVYLLTTQSHVRLSYASDSETPNYVDREILSDLWAFDAKTAAPVWRKRLRTKREDAVSNHALFGAEGDTIWIVLPEGPFAVSAATGNILCDPVSVAAKNPALTGVLPQQKSSYRFGANGLQFQAADGRQWSLHPKTFTVQHPNTTSPSAVVPASHSISSSRSLMSRGLNIPGRWLGVLDDEEAALLRDKSLMYPDLDRQARRKLWGARVNNGVFTQLVPLTGEFLAPGLLGLNNQPFLPRNPDSVLILHQDRLDDSRRMQLTRIAGPGGNTVWNVSLPFTVVQSALPGDGPLVLFGVQFIPPRNEGPRDPFHAAHHILCAIDLATGAQHSYDLSDLDRNPPVTP